MRFKAKSKRFTIPDSEQRGLYIRVNTSGKISFFAVTRDLNRKLIWVKLNSILIDAARTEAKAVLQKIVSGEPLAGPLSFAVVAEDWYKKKSRRRLRTAKESCGAISTSTSFPLSVETTSSRSGASTSQTCSTTSKRTMAHALPIW